jgi:hypothetical protein
MGKPVDDDDDDGDDGIEDNSEDDECFKLSEGRVDPVNK